MITTINEWKKINEIGDGSTIPYKYTLIHKNDHLYIAEFSTEYYNYTVNFSILNTNNHGDILTIGFYVNIGEEIETNEGNHYKIMITIVNACKEILNKENNIKNIHFEAKKKKNSKNNQRLLLYSTFAKNHLGPEWKIKIDKSGAVIYKQ